MPNTLESVLSNPWPVAVVLVIVAAGLHAAGQRRLRRTALVVGLLAVVVVAAAFAIETDTEAAERRSRALVAATAPLDLPEFSARLSPQVRLLGPDGALWLDGKQLLARLESLTTSATLDQRVVDLTVDPAGGDPDQRTATLELRTHTSTLAGVPLRSSWALTWRRGGGGWLLTDAQWLRFNQKPPPRELLR